MQVAVTRHGIARFLFFMTDPDVGRKEHGTHKHQMLHSMGLHVHDISLKQKTSNDIDVFSNSFGVFEFELANSHRSHLQ